VSFSEVFAFLSPASVGALERRNPLPPGRYWVDVPDPKAAAFEAWRSRNGASIIVEATERREGDVPVTWTLFRTTAPVPWEGPGIPTIATADVKSAEDTAQRPAPEPDPLTKIPNPADFVPSSRTIALAVGGVALVVGLVFLAGRH
jgi:hypothetical protein